MTQRPILVTVNRDEFVGRDAVLREIVQRVSSSVDAHGLLLQVAPAAGGGEVLRQAYDQLFARRGETIPVYFAFRQSDATAMDTARRFFQTVMRQYVAYRRVDPSLCKAPLTFHDLSELALPGDYELVNNLLEAFNREQANEQGLVSFCFSLPQRLTTEGRRIYSLINCMAVRPFREDVMLARSLTSAITSAGGSFAIAALRRQASNLIHAVDDVGRGAADAIHVERLSDDDAHRLVEVLARREAIEVNAPTVDLIVQQFNGSPFLIDAFIKAAHETKTQLTSFLNCQRLYVDDLMGGHIKRYFDRIFEVVAPNNQTRRTLLRVLYESAISETRKSSLWAWKKRLGVGAPEFEQIIDALHVCELVNSTAAFIEVNTESYVWRDYLHAQYRTEVAAEPRAKVVATTLLESLKRAPQAMARKYRRAMALGLGDLLAQFNCQTVPATLFHYDRFAAAYKGETQDVIEVGLDAEADLIRLPQIVYTAAGSAYSAAIACEAERCAVGHGFEAAEYTAENEVVWLAAEIDSKLEASRELAADWSDRLAALARESGFDRYRIWLVAREGFSKDACELLNEREAFGSNRQQVDLLTARVRSEAAERDTPKADEYEMVIPMGEDTELIAAHTVEQIARRVHFRPEAINQIKTALVEACINAAEHSLSPDRKIYQRFVVEDDKLVVTVASRGVVPAQLSASNGQDERAIDPKEQANGGRRGWGLKVIKTLMDEVEFERVDDGTQLRMTKYIR